MSAIVDHRKMRENGLGHAKHDGSQWLIRMDDDGISKDFAKRRSRYCRVRDIARRRGIVFVSRRKEMPMPEDHMLISINQRQRARSGDCQEEDRKRTTDDVSKA